MKIEKLDDDNFIVFLNKFYLKKNLFELKKNINIYFKDLFKVLNSFYNIEMIGYYNVRIFYDKIYGYILDIEKEGFDIDFCNYYDDHVDMRILINDPQIFLFKPYNNSLIDEKILKYCYLKKLDSDIYLVPKKTINQYQLGNLIENSIIIYGIRANEILNKCKTICTKEVFV